MPLRFSLFYLINKNMTKDTELAGPFSGKATLAVKFSVDLVE
jgi:hypothetical protein